MRPEARLLIDQRILCSDCCQRMYYSFMINFVLNEMLNWFSMPVLLHCISATKQGPL